MQPGMRLVKRREGGRIPGTIETMDRHASQLAVAAQAPIAQAQPADYAAQLIKEIRAKLTALGYTRETGRAWIVRNLQVTEWSPNLLELASVESLSVLLDRLITEQERRADQYRHVSHDDFWRLQRQLGVSRQVAASIVAAFVITEREVTRNGQTETIIEAVDWPGAYEDLQRRFGAVASAA